MVLKNSPLRLAKWIFVFKKKSVEDVALYHSLNLEVVFLEKKFQKVVKFLEKGTTVDHLAKGYNIPDQKVLYRIIKELFSKGLIVNVDNEDTKLLEEKRRSKVLPVGLLGMYLMLTDACNLKCKYCFINNNMPTDYKCSSMNWEVARQAVDMYFLNLSRNPLIFDNFQKTISFYGGEPLLNFPLVRRVVEYIQSVYGKEVERMGENFQYSLVTNGTLVTEEIAAFLSQHKSIMVGVSIDGEKNIHDAKRVYPDGRGSFAKAIKGCESLIRTGCTKISLSCTIDKHNIENLDTLLNLHEKYGFMSINLNPLLDTEKDRVSKKYIKRVSVRMLDYFEKARERGIYEERIMRKLKSFVFHEIHAFDCEGTGNQIVCSPDGKLGVCHEGIGLKNFFFAKVSRNFDFHNNSVVNEWNARSPLNMPQCFECPAIGICGGGCTYGAYLRNGSIWSIDDRFCVHSLKTLEWLIWDLHKR